MAFYVLTKALLLYALVFCDLIVCKKVPQPSLKSVESSSINECQRCKVLTDSFSHWLEKTSRGKFEGGDAAWEEAKLKSYARSEIRLVEIQEGICSELKKHQDQCYNLAEEAEQALEKWWFHEDPNSVDLYTWLCIETLQYCCPPLHFGDTCSPCPLDKNNQVCGGRGRCDGDGTRKGNGSCICKKGYAGHYCENCAKNFYSANNDLCEACHIACDGCSGGGTASCDKCNSGWELDSGVCVDINECNIASNCKHNEYCINKEGTFICKTCDKSCTTCVGAGNSNCTSCAPNATLWSGVCVDEKLKSDILKNTLRRLVLYLGLLLITYFILRRSRILASLVVLVIAVYIYFSEQSSQMNIVDVITKMYFK